jgi:hypothetical protein
VVLGVAMLGLFIIGLTMQTATTESYGLQISDTTVWDLFVSTISQLPGLFTGNVLISQLPRILIGWGIEILYYAYVTNHRKIKQGLDNHHPWAVKALDAAAVAAVIYCAFTDWMYAQQLIPNIWGQFIFTVLISVMVAYCGVLGVNFIKSGFGH